MLCAPVLWRDGNSTILEWKGFLPKSSSPTSNFFQSHPVQPLCNEHRPQPRSRICSSPSRCDLTPAKSSVTVRRSWGLVWKSSAAVAADVSSELELPSVCWLYGTKEAKLLSTAESCALLASPFGRAIFQPLLARSQSEPFLAGITTNRKITVLTAFNYRGWNIIVVSLGPDVGLEFLKVTFPLHNETCFTWDSLKPINYACCKNLLLYSKDMIQTPIVVIGDPQDLDHILNQLYGQLSK